MRATYLANLILLHLIKLLFTEEYNLFSLNPLLVPAIIVVIFKDWFHRLIL